MMYSPPECKALSSLLSLLPLNPEGRSFLEVFFFFFLFLPKLYIRYLYRFFVVVSIFFFFLRARLHSVNWKTKPPNSHSVLFVVICTEPEWL